MLIGVEYPSVKCPAFLRLTFHCSSIECHDSQFESCAANIGGESLLIRAVLLEGRILVMLPYVPYFWYNYITLPPAPKHSSALILEQYPFLFSGKILEHCTFM